MLYIYKNIKITQYKNLNDRLYTAYKYNTSMWESFCTVFPGEKKKLNSLMDQMIKAICDGGGGGRERKRRFNQMIDDN